MASWVNRKTIDNSIVNMKILECVESKHFTNGGKNVTDLQNVVKTMFAIDIDKEVLMVCNGAMGLNALVSGFNMFYNKKLRWAVQSFTFPCSVQGNLFDSLVFDLDENMGPDINMLEENKDLYDGIIVTNCFGTSVNIELYETFCKLNNKILLFDNAASSYTMYKDKNHLNYGDGCFVSLHHTKPIGFGEGGFIIFKKHMLSFMERSICFGFTKENRMDFSIYANNYKMSEISAIYINEYLKNLLTIINHHTNIVKYFMLQIKNLNLDTSIKLYKSFSEYDSSLLSTIPILFEMKVDTNEFLKNNVEAKKYYFPLNKLCKHSNLLFDNLVCLPLNLDVTYETIDLYISIIKKILINT